MTHERNGWTDLPICPPCLLGAHHACDGGRFWCECTNDHCLPAMNGDRA